MRALRHLGKLTRLQSSINVCGCKRITEERNANNNLTRDGRLHVSASLLLRRDRYFFFIIFHLNASRSLSRRRIHVSPLSPTAVSLTDGNRFLIASPSRCRTPSSACPPAVYTVQSSTSGWISQRDHFHAEPGRCGYRNIATIPFD